MLEKPPACFSSWVTVTEKIKIWDKREITTENTGTLCESPLRLVCCWCDSRQNEIRWYHERHGTDLVSRSNFWTRKKRMEKGWSNRLWEGLGDGESTKLVVEYGWWGTKFCCGPKGDGKIYFGPTFQMFFIHLNLNKKSVKIPESLKLKTNYRPNQTYPNPNPDPVFDPDS